MRQIIQQQPGLLLSEFSDLLTGKIKLQVPVFTVWGACEDVAILERFRTGEYQVNNLLCLTRLRPGYRSRRHPIASLWSRWCCGASQAVRQRRGCRDYRRWSRNNVDYALQIGELIDTAQKTFDPTETRLLITHASPVVKVSSHSWLWALKADLTVSAGLHFRYGVSYNEFSVQHDAENYRNKLQHAKQSFGEIWDTVKSKSTLSSTKTRGHFSTTRLPWPIVSLHSDSKLARLARNQPGRTLGTGTCPTRRTAFGVEHQGWQGQRRNQVAGIQLCLPPQRTAYERCYTHSSCTGCSEPHTHCKHSRSCCCSRCPAPAAPATSAQKTNTAAPAAAPASKAAPNKPAAEASTVNGGASAPAAFKSAPTAVTSSTTKPVKEKKERAPRERGHESSASRSDFDGGFHLRHRWSQISLFFWSS